MSTAYFERITANRRRSGKCPVCGKRTTRSHTFWMTVSPFNRNEDGTVRTPREVRAVVEEEADQWEPDFHHDACREGQR